jgi:hypothetical protein
LVLETFCGKLLDSEGSLKTLAMVDNSNCNNPRDEVEERFSNLEEQVVDISCNMVLLMESLVNKFVSFREVGGSNS